MGRLADAIDEGVAISYAAARLAVKNHILVETIARGESFEPERFASVARDTLQSLADEAQDAASLAERQRKRAWGKYSDPDGTHDYRDRDVRNLRRRRKQYLGVAERLRTDAENHEAVRALVEDAREAAWTDVEANLARRLKIEGMRPDLDPDYERMREARMEALQMVDLQRLAAQAKRKAEREAETSTAESPDGADPKPKGSRAKAPRRGKNRA